MRINFLKFGNYRNLKDVTISPDENINILYGDNAQGKTNILESIWLFTGGKSFRGAKDKELINFESEISKIEMDFFSKGRDQKAIIKIENNKRYAILNDIEKKSASTLIGSFCSVVFSPMHLSLIKDGPNLRRKFIDAAICQIKPSYAPLLIKYNHTLLQRNTLIKDIKYHSELMDTLDVWDSKLARYGSLIIEQRLRYVEKLRKSAKNIYSGISDCKEEFDISYKACFKFDKNSDNLESKLLEEIRKSLNTDLKFGFTSVGPHREDINIYVENLPAKNFASQGQQRSCVLALKLAEAEILTSSIGEKPVILLDDVMSELDNKRQDYILNSIKGFQVFITCCEPSTVLRMTKGKKFHLAAGRVEPSIESHTACGGALRT